MKLKSLEHLFVQELKDAHNAEKMLIDALPKMAEKASASDLKQAFQTHLEQTKRHKDMVEEILIDLGQTPSGVKCEGMEGIIKEGEKLLKERNADADTLDAGLIVSAQKAEHYEIATYGTLRTYANELGNTKAADKLDRILEEESQTNEKLTKIAVSHVNLDAAKERM